MPNLINYRTGKPIKTKLVNSDTLVGKVFRSKTNLVKALYKTDLQPTGVKMGWVNDDFIKNHYTIELERKYYKLTLPTIWVKVKLEVKKDSMGRNCKTETIIEIIK